MRPFLRLLDHDHHDPRIHCARGIHGAPASRHPSAGSGHRARVRHGTPEQDPVKKIIVNCGGNRACSLQSRERGPIRRLFGHDERVVGRTEQGKGEYAGTVEYPGLPPFPRAAFAEAAEELAFLVPVIVSEYAAPAPGWRELWRGDRYVPLSGGVNEAASIRSDRAFAPGYYPPDTLRP